MRVIGLAVVVCVAACGTSDSNDPEDAGRSDASAAGDATSDDAGLADASGDGDAATIADAGADADGGPDGAPDAATCPTTLLVGGSDVAAQGWSTTMQAPAALTYVADDVRLETSTLAAATTSGQLLLVRPRTFEAGKPFKVEIVMLVESVNPHNLLDSAAAILGSFTPPAGVGADRAEMVYLDPGAVGWADNTQSSAVTIQDGAYHTYVLAVDDAGVARVSVDGVARLTRSGFVSNGTLAIGDQTNDPGVDARVRVRSVTLLCP